jgi:hypothetical protein
MSSGALSAAVRASLDAEGMLLLDERLRGSLTYRHYRAPGRRSSWRKVSTAGAIAVTEQRLLVWTGGTTHIDVPHKDPLRAAIEVTVDKPGRICFAYDAHAFHDDRSGQVEVRLKTARADEIAGLLATTA